jgi:hypothetical protein
VQVFHLAHPAYESSSSPPIPPSRTFGWHMVFQPFKEIANRLALFLSHLSLPNPLRLRRSLWKFLPGLGRYQHYQSLAEEQRWWDESVRVRAFFARSDARHGVTAPPGLTPVPLIMSYVPRLLPAYRDHRRLDDAANECELTPSVYRKWHRLVYPHKVCIALVTSSFECSSVRGELS